MCFSVLAAFLALSSAAYACTTFYGKITVTGTSGSTTAYGNQTTHGYCSGPVSNSPNGAKAHSSDSITVAVASGTASCPISGALPGKTYDVNFLNTTSAYTCSSTCATTGTTYTPGANFTTTDNCMDDTNGNPAHGSRLGTMSVNSSGTGSGSYTLPSSLTNNGSTNASNVCVSDNTGLNGIEAPIIIY